MTDYSDDADVVNRLLRSAFGNGEEEVVQTLIEHVAGTAVFDLHRPGNRNEFEVWFGGNASLTGDELRALQRLFDVKEMGVYGDRNLAGTEEDNGLEGRFHAILIPNPDGE